MMSRKDDQEQALAAALRENLRRRKAQARAAQEPPAATPGEATPLSAEARTNRA